MSNATGRLIATAVAMTAFARCMAQTPGAGWVMTIGFYGFLVATLLFVVEYVRAQKP